MKKSTCFEIVRNDKVGRYVVAKEEIADGQIIFQEPPLSIGPNRFTHPICLGCHHSVDGSYFCSECGFPMCSLKCQNMTIHADNECKVFRKKGSRPKKFPNYTTIQPIYQCIFPLRLILLKVNDPGKWTKLGAMQCHSQIRREVWEEDWHMNEVNVVQFLRGWCGLEEVDSDIIHRVIGIIEVNCFQVKPISGIEVSGMYEFGSILMQDCIPNTHHAFTPDGQLIFRSSVPIRKGQPITMSYAPLLIGSLERRQYLRATKYFECDCSRCADPTESGTYISGIKCSSCPSGYLLPTNPLDKDSSWVCYKDQYGERNSACNNTLTIVKVQTMMTEMKNSIQKAIDLDDSRKSLKLLLEGYSGKSLHPNHFLLIPILEKLNRINNSDTESGGNGDKGEVGQRLLKILDKLQPGLSRSRGVILYEICISNYGKIKLDLEANAISKEEFELVKCKIEKELKFTERIFELDKLIGVKNLRVFTL